VSAYGHTCPVANAMEPLGGRWARRAVTRRLGLCSSTTGRRPAAATP
jgi:hypothetical protein